VFTRLTRNQQSHRNRLGLVLAAVLAASALAPVAAEAADPASVAPVADPTGLTLASFNVLGSSHTRHSRRFATGVERMANVVRLLERHDVEVVGFQELQADQLTSFLTRTAGRYEVYPGFQLRLRDTDNSIAWDTSQWQPLEETTVLIPYFDGRLRPMPVVKLRNVQTGMTAWFANFHNPATNRAHPGQDGWRAQAIALEVELAKQLKATGLPVFFTGDMNERDEVFCPMTGQAPMRAARGGTNRNGVCDPQRPWYVDWIFGLKRQPFTNYVEDAGALVKRTTDHPVIVADVQIDPVRFPSATTPPVQEPPVPQQPMTIGRGPWPF
jgi:Endonuclease/Exonuclease/phosphatase family